MATLANSEDQDQMLQNVAFHQGMPCLLKTKSIFGKHNTKSTLGDNAI